LPASWIYRLISGGVAQGAAVRRCRSRREDRARVASGRGQGTGGRRGGSVSSAGQRTAGVRYVCGRAGSLARSRRCATCR
jgi:hypothetical protein